MVKFKSDKQRKKVMALYNRHNSSKKEYRYLYNYEKISKQSLGKIALVQGCSLILPELIPVLNSAYNFFLLYKGAKIALDIVEKKTYPLLPNNLSLNEINKELQSIPCSIVLKFNYKDFISDNELKENSLKTKDFLIQIPIKK